MKRFAQSLLPLFIFATAFSQGDTSVAKTDTTNFNFFPIFSTTGDEAESDMDQQDMSTLLQSSRDVFLQFASFQFGPARYRTRGYAANQSMVMVNGVSMSDPETGFSSWSTWGGLNDVTKNTEVRFGNVNNRFGYSAAGGYVNIDSKASSFKPGTRLSYVNANRFFRQRLMLTHSTGLMKNGWAFSLSASSRTGNEVYIPGTYFNAGSFYCSIDRQLNSKNVISFTGFYAPVEKGRSGAATLEAYALAGDYYNSQWGYQNGKVRNASVNSVRRPVLMVSHINQRNASRKFTNTIYYTFGEAVNTGLNWNDASNPRPDYYRYLPSYFYSTGNAVTGDLISAYWREDENTRQINWDRMIDLNRNNLFALPGQTVVTDETRARYILETRVEYLNKAGYNGVHNFRLNNWFISTGLNGFIHRSRKYKQLDDLLGATFWIDHDQFAPEVGVDATVKQNDISNPDRKVKEGDRFGYDYSININQAQVWTQAERTFRKADVYAAVFVSQRSVWREGYVANGKFPENSKGESQKSEFSDAGVKGGIIYKISGRHFVMANCNLMSRAPETNNLFLSPTTRNDLIANVRCEINRSCDISYEAKYPDLRVRISGYSTRISGATRVRTYWHDGYNNTVNLVIRNLDLSYQGIEIGAEKLLFTSHVVQFAAGAGQFLYASRPLLEAWQDNNNAPVFSERVSYLKNYRVGGTPQMVMGLGYRYNAKRRWYVGINLNYLDHIYIEPNPDRRTKEAVDKFLSNETEQYQEVIGQERLPSYYLVNANCGKSFRVFHNYYLNAGLSLNNLLNTRNILVSGYESMRWDEGNIMRFPNKYYYMTGTTYMLIINFSF